MEETAKLRALAHMLSEWSDWPDSELVQLCLAPPPGEHKGETVIAATLGQLRREAQGTCAPSQDSEARALLEALVKAVDGLIDDSQGVYGLHLNGDPAPWSSLTAGGRFEEWLLPLDDARVYLTRTAPKQGDERPENVAPKKDRADKMAALFGAKFVTRKPKP